MTDNHPRLPSPKYGPDTTVDEDDDPRGAWSYDQVRAAIDADRAARGAVPAGWVMVPKDPTPEMLKAGHAYGYPPNIWAAMINAAPVAQAKPEQAAQPRDQIGADRLAAAVARLVSSRSIDARSEAADALLDYLDVGGVGGPSDVPAWLAQYEKRQAAAAPQKPKD